MPLPGLPVHDPIAEPADPRQGRDLPMLVVGYKFGRWLSSLIGAVNRSSERRASVRLTTQGASIGTTAIPTGTIEPGLWRVSYYARITQVASTSSELTIGFGWTDGGVAQTVSGALMNGNLLTTHQFGTLVIRSDMETPISYNTTYASVGGTPMRYRLSITLQALDLEVT